MLIEKVEADPARLQAGGGPALPIEAADIPVRWATLRTCEPCSIDRRRTPLRAPQGGDTHYDITGPGEKSGADGREEILQRGDWIGIPRPSLPAVRAGVIIEAAATAAGLDPRAVRASWRVGSGFAHGRFWPA